MQRWLLLLGLAAACSDDDAAPPPDPTPGRRTITTHEALTLVGSDGTRLALPVDLDGVVVQVHAQIDERWEILAGDGTAQGTTRTERVPSGAGWLRLDYLDAALESQPRNEYFFLDGEDDIALDLGSWRTGRAGMKHATEAATQVAFEMSGLAPWQPGFDLAVVFVPNLGFVQVFDIDGEGITGMPIANATSSQLRVDWVTAIGGPVVDAARGDRAYAMQFRFRQVGAAYVGAPVRAVQLPPFTVQNGGAIGVATAFAQPAPLRVRVAMDRDAFDAMRPALGANVGPAFARGFAIEALPETNVADAFSVDSVPAELVVIDGDLAARGRLDLGDVDIASPWPASSAFAYYASAYAMPLERDDGVIAQAVVQVGAMTNALPTASAPAAPLIGPARDVEIGAGLTPTITWEPPSVGVATAYEVKILAPGGADPTYDYVWYPAAVFHVPGAQTSLVLPPEILQRDVSYAVAIRAITNASKQADARRSIALPYGWADTITQARKP